MEGAGSDGPVPWPPAAAPRGARPGILTQQPQAPWWAVAVILLPWAAIEMHNQLSRSAIAFTLRKFTDDPALIGFVSSLNFACGLSVGSVMSLLSDQLWTRHGRRRPFLIAGYFSAALACLLLPHLPVFWGLLIGIFLYQALFDLGNPYEPLTMEVIPPHQRGRAGAIRQWYSVGAYLLFYYVLIRQFESRHVLPGGLVITGETVLYLVNALLLLLGGAIFLFFVREVRPAEAETRRWRDLSVPALIRGLFTRELLPLFGLAFVMMNLWLGLDQFEALLITDQWGYSKSEYGALMSYGMLITVAVVPIGGWASDRFDRLTLLQWGLVAVLGLKLVFYVYVEHLAPGGVPPFGAVVALCLVRAALQKMAVVAALPLIFDYVSANRLGALSCGMALVYGLVNFAGSNAMGLWIKSSSRWLYELPEGTYNYMAGYHWLFLMSALSLAYLSLFSRWTRHGHVKRRPPGLDAAPPA